VDECRLGYAVARFRSSKYREACQENKDEYIQLKARIVTAMSVMKVEMSQGDTYSIPIAQLKKMMEAASEKPGPKLNLYAKGGGSGTAITRVEAAFAAATVSVFEKDLVKVTANDAGRNGYVIRGWGAPEV
jgi:hypothetical protein